MPGEVDKLQVRIEADTSKAVQAIDNLYRHLLGLRQQTGKIVGGFTQLSNSMKQLRIDSQNLKGLANPFGKANVSKIRETKETVESLDKSVDSLGGSFKSIGSWVSGVSKVFEPLGNAIKKVTDKVRSFFRSIVRIAMYRAIRSALRAITQGFSTGIENLYLWSQAVNTNFAPAMDRLATTMLYLKNGFASMFSPLIEYFTPYIELLVDKLVDAFNWVQRLFAQLTGKTTWYKAVKVQTQYKEATDSTAKSVKALRQEIQLMDFDELNNLTDNPDNGSGSGSGDVLNPNPRDMFVLQETGLDKMEGTLWENIKQKIQEWLEGQGLWDENGFNWYALGEIIGTKLGDLWGTITQWWDSIGGWQAVVDGIAAAIEDAVDFIDGVIDGLFPGRKESREEFDAQKAFNQEVTDAVEEANIRSSERTRVKIGNVPDEDYWQDQITTITGDIFTLSGLQAQNQERLAQLEAKKASGEDWNEYDTRNLTAAQFTETYLQQAISGLQKELDSADVYYRLAQEGEEYTGTFMEKVTDYAAEAVSNGRIDDDINNLLDTIFDSRNIANTLNNIDSKVNNWLDRILRLGSYGSTGHHGYGGRFASGGYVSQGTMFVAGESGAEFVGNINGRTGVASGAEITGIGDAVWSTGNLTNNLLAELISVVRNKDLTISPSANLGKVVNRSQQLYRTQTG